MKKPVKKAAPLKPITATKAWKSAFKIEPKPAYRAAGYNEHGVEAYIKVAEDHDRGTTRFPWPADFKAKLKADLNGLHTVDEMKAKLNAAVVASLGGGLHNRGPLA